MNLCACGCGAQTRNTYKRGHARGISCSRIPFTQLEVRRCVCGCGKLLTPRYCLNAKGTSGSWYVPSKRAHPNAAVSIPIEEVRRRLPPGYEEKELARRLGYGYISRMWRSNARIPGRVDVRKAESILRAAWGLPRQPLPIEKRRAERELEQRYERADTDERAWLKEHAGISDRVKERARRRAALRRRRTA